jgi:hypothetical protein
MTKIKTQPLSFDPNNPEDIDALKIGRQAIQDRKEYEEQTKLQAEQARETERQKKEEQVKYNARMVDVKKFIKEHKIVSKVDYDFDLRYIIDFVLHGSEIGNIKSPDLTKFILIHPDEIYDIMDELDGDGLKYIFDTEEDLLKYLLRDSTSIESFIEYVIPSSILILHNGDPFDLRLSLSVVPQINGKKKNEKKVVIK